MTAANNYTNEKYPLSELTGKIIKCAIEVHQHLGNGFQEVIYQRALPIEFTNQFLLEVGLLINFGSSSLQFKRVMNKKLQSQS